MIMEELLIRLERQIKELIGQHTQLKQSNIHEKQLLLVKQQKAITQIQALVSKLKLIEKSS